MRDGRIRGRFHFHNTLTGRTSSDNPNMQNIPKGKTVTALAVKRVYTVEARHLMVCADYSQAEVRWLAQMTGDKYLQNAFLAVAKVQAAYKANPTPENFKRMIREGDFHRQTAAQIFGKPPEKISDLERGAAKSIVFGLIYGMSTFGLAAGLKIPYEQAEEYRNKFLNQFPEAKAWLYKMESQGFEQGYVDAPNGRRRHLISGFVVTEGNEFFEANGRRVPTKIGKYHQYEDRVCRNAPIQVIASDTNLRACFAIQKFIERHHKPWKLLITVHDSVIAEIPREDVIEYMGIAQGIMEDPKIFAPFGIEMTVPFVADFSLGSNWADQTDIDIAEKYVVRCNACGGEREEKKRTKNRRCEECGSRKIEEIPKKAPLEIALKYWDWKLGYQN
jgi:DNA polymerase-1